MEFPSHQIFRGSSFWDGMGLDGMELDCTELSIVEAYTNLLDWFYALFLFLSPGAL